LDPVILIRLMPVPDGLSRQRYSGPESLSSEFALGSPAERVRPCGLVRRPVL